LSAFDVAAAEHTQRRHVADADEFCCRFERNFAALCPLAVAEDGDVVVIAEAAHALLRPGLAVPGLDASAIEQARDLSIRHQPRQLTHDRDVMRGLTWLQDSRSIVYASSRETTVPYLPPLALWQISVDGGEPRQMKTSRLASHSTICSTP